MAIKPTDNSTVYIEYISVLEYYYGLCISFEHFRVFYTAAFVVVVHRLEELFTLL